MQKTSIKQIREVAQKRRPRKRLTAPQYEPTRLQYRNGATNDLTKTILDYINTSGSGLAERVNSTGHQLEEGIRRWWIPTAGQCGFADIAAIKLIEIDGRKVAVKVAIEIKGGGDWQSVEQRVYQYQVEQAGGVYIVAGSLEQFKEAWKKI
jgi:hypothetical protein